jgi:hypothetical protein
MKIRGAAGDEARSRRATVRWIAAHLFYTAEGRVDFEPCAIWLPIFACESRCLIGVRDEARMLGGYGSCGRPLRDVPQTFEPISIKMAKKKSASTRQAVGMCGRLGRCLHTSCERQGVARRLRRRGRLRSCSNPTGPGVSVGCGSCGTGGWELRVSRPRIGVTVGDPAGIGPEIARKAAADPAVASACDIVFYGPSSDDAIARFDRGRVSAAAGQAAYEAIVAATADAQAGRIDAIATAPINKEAFAAAGLPWRGHTDLLAHLTGAPRVAMMFYAEALRVVLATVHIRLPTCRGRRETCWKGPLS